MLVCPLVGKVRSLLLPKGQPHGVLTLGPLQLCTAHARSLSPTALQQVELQDRLNCLQWLERSHNTTRVKLERDGP